jgi:phosphatidylglycerol lysyltransferase
MLRLRDVRSDEPNLISREGPNRRTEATAIDNAGPATESFEPRRVDSLSREDFDALERLAFEHGETAESYLAVEPERHCILTADRQAAVSVILVGRGLHIAGGILAAPERRLRMILDLTEFARSTGRGVACYAVGERDRPLFEEAGWEVSKFGEDTELDLETHRWSGKPYEWVRRQFNFCVRAGLDWREIVPEDLAEGEWDRTKEVLFEILREDLRDRIYAKEMGLLVGKLQPDNLGRRRLFVAENEKTGVMEAFLVANPMDGGRGWAIESYRKRQSATRGAIPFLMKATIDKLQLEGARRVSLCMLLFKDTDTFAGNQAGGMLHWWLSFGRRIANRLYRADGMTHFKTRFRPTLTNIYLCVTPRTTLVMSLGFLWSVGAFSISAPNVLRSAGQALFGRVRGIFAGRNNGAAPQSEPESERARVAADCP